VAKVNLFLNKFCLRVWLIGALLVGTTHLVHAQNCPEGMVPEGGQGVASCAPANGGQPSGHWLSRWGAIATDVVHQGVGASLNQPDEERAKEAAIANCLSNGGLNCKIETTYFNSCIAMVVGDNGYEISIDKTQELAAEKGLKICNGAGYSNCRARYMSCSTAQWVPNS
jgi:hypothetical protein